MVRRSTQSAADAHAQERRTAAVTTAPPESADTTRAMKAQSRAARAESKAGAKAAKVAGKQERKTSAADSKHRKSETRASRKASRAEAKAAKASVKASEAEAATKATRPARMIGKITDPKIAKRAVTIGKIVAPALAPVLIKATVGTRHMLDEARARKLGVSVDQVAAFRGPTGPAGARITGLTLAVRELAGRKTNDLQITRFAEVASTRLKDLTAAVQASATMPRARRNEVLHAVGRELDDIDADLVAHLMGSVER
jgi:hypothetical protein